MIITLIMALALRRAFLPKIFIFIFNILQVLQITRCVN